MDFVTHLTIAALFSLHQYIPQESMNVKYFETVVDPVSFDAQYEGMTIVAAAHESCRYLLKNMGTELDFSEPELVGFLFGIVDQQKENLKEVQSSADAVKDVIRRVCQKDLDFQSFSTQQREDIAQFIKKNISILSKKEIESSGQFRFFGKTNLYDRNGQLLGPLFSLTEQWIPFSEISPLVVKAVVAAEDKNFFVHDGVHLGSLIRMVYNMKSSDDSNITGGSTLTMQLLKNLYFKDRVEDEGLPVQTDARMATLLRKVREWYWAKVYEKHHEKLGPGSGKKYVLENYLNLMDYGPGIRGIDQASQVFFKKTPDQIDLAGAAFIASLFKAPSRYAVPDNYEKYTTSRRTYVLEQMAQLDGDESQLEPITSDQKKLALEQPMPMWSPSNFVEVDTAQINTYVRTYAKSFLNSQIELPSGQRAIEPELTTTIDSELQAKVYQIVRSKIDEYDAMPIRADLQRAGPARDDRSRVAIPSADDISYKSQDELRQLRSLYDGNGIHAQMIVYLGVTEDIKGNQIKSFYFLSDSKNEKSETKEFRQALEKMVSSQALAVGQIFAVQIQDAAECISDCMALVGSESLIEEPTATAEVEEKIRTQIVKTYLVRMQGLAPREGWVPAFLPNAQSTSLLAVGATSSVSELLEVSLSSNFGGQNHQKFLTQKISRRQFREGQVFWVQKDSVEATTYHFEVPRLQAAVVVMNSQNGEVLANFGGYWPQSSKYFDRSRLGQRQPGSTLKPWLYYLALSKGFQPDTMISNEPMSIQVDKNSFFRPDNFSGGGPSQVSMFTGLSKSLNRAAAGLLLDPRFGAGPRESVQEFRLLLSDIELYPAPDRVFIPAVVLGGIETTVLKLVSSFTFFANGQNIVKPTFFKSLVNGKGETLYQGSTETVAVPFSENREAVLNIQQMMIGVANGDGTAGRLNAFTRDVLQRPDCQGSIFGGEGQVCFGGKTGTSNNFKDNWFIGFSRNFVIGVWVGYDYPESTQETGGKLALPIFMDIVQQGQNNLPAIEPIVDGLSFGNQDFESGAVEPFEPVPPLEMERSLEVEEATGVCMINQGEEMCRASCSCEVTGTGSIELYINGRKEGTITKGTLNARKRKCLDVAQKRGCS